MEECLSAGPGSVVWCHGMVDGGWRDTASFMGVLLLLPLVATNGWYGLQGSKKEGKQEC